MSFMRKALLLTTISLALVSGGAAQPSKEWVKVNPEADWNNFPESEIQEFEGCLEVDEESETISFVMRFNPFKLKMDRARLDVYGRSPVLEEYVGKQVVIRGKRVQDEIEGQVFDEIWPVSIKLKAK